MTILLYTTASYLLLMLTTYFEIKKEKHPQKFILFSCFLVRGRLGILLLDTVFYALLFFFFLISSIHKYEKSSLNIFLFRRNERLD